MIDRLEQQFQRSVVAADDLVFRHGVSAQSNAIADPRNIDLRIIRGHVVEIGAIAELLHLCQQLHLAGMGHDAFKREADPALQ